MLIRPKSKLSQLEDSQVESSLTGLLSTDLEQHSSQHSWLGSPNTTSAMLVCATAPCEQWCSTTPGTDSVHLIQGYQEAVHHFRSHLGYASSGAGYSNEVPAGYSAAAAIQESQTALAAVGEETRKYLLASRTQSAMENTVAEFGNFLQHHAVPGRNTWGACTDLEVLHFVKAHYLVNHHGRNGGEVVPSVLRGMISRLSRAFIAHGRAGPWYDAGGAQPVGNPALSPKVSDYCKAFATKAQLHGYLETSAVPMPQSVLRKIIEVAEAESHAAYRRQQLTKYSSAAEVLMHERDAASFAVLWHSYRRGQDILNLTWEGLQCRPTAGGKLMPLVEYWTQHLTTLPLPCELVAQPIQTKTEASERPGSWTFTCQQDHSFCAVARLSRLFAATVLARGMQALSGPVFTTLTRGRHSALSSSALNQRLNAAAERLPAAEMQAILPLGRKFGCHSCRRGHLQHDAALGMSEPELMRRAGLKTLEVLRRYLDQGRHLP